MKAGALGRHTIEVSEYKETRTASGAITKGWVVVGKVRAYRTKSRPYTYWQEKRAEERFVDWQVELLIRADKRFDWEQSRVRYEGRLYRIMFHETEKGQTRLICRQENT